ncbi:MAG: ribonuclease R [Methylotenera sp.]|uniref:ribonuclease R n=1 Tax=Methylotenera sp. TaxID=2051956 RepID=UPI000D44AA14|nr:ribonuclease R [Methylotenera sp.]PPC81140.1 MAG: ribonuclease R [Methylotenera sp.]
MTNHKNTPKNKRSHDPHAAREASRYETPLPSRELILSTMSDQGVPLSVEQLYLLLDISNDEREIFNRRLNAMEREGQIIKNRKGALCIADKLDLIAGVIQGHPDGFGFLIPDDKTKSEDLFLSPKEMSQVMHGDRAMVRMSGLDRRGRPEGKIVEVLERRTQRLVGRVLRASGVTIVAAEDKRINLDILIPYHLDMQAKPGQVVMVELTEQPSSHAQPMGKVVEILGNYADSGMEIEIALRKHNLPYQFSAEAINLAESYPKLVQPDDYEGRIDCREMPLITIDGETARDFDDAVYAEPQGKGWRLVVAIADVSFYVRPHDALDKGALERGNSVYFPRRVIPMLPEALSNGLCSLNPDVERLCMICDMQIDGAGIVKQYKFYPSVMRSKARMTYNKVFEMLQNPEGELAQEYAWLMPHLQHLNSVYQLLQTQREKRGAIEFESSETMMIFNDQGKIERIEPSTRNEAHKLIEECMLAANVCAAQFLKKHEHPALYRIHEGPTPEKLELLRTFMGEFGFGVGGGDSPHAKDYGKLLARIKDRPDAQLLQTVLLRSMQQAVYSPDNVGHFGLAYEAYAHFTSPIRRYPDLLIHRAIKAVLNGERYKAGDWNSLGEQCSMTERRADDATRDVTNWLKCFYMQDKIGEVFEGTVAGVTSFGLFVALDNVYVEGLLHVTELGNDYFIYDKARHEMAGERTGIRYRLGDRLTIKVVRVDLETTKIDFTLVNKNNELPVESNVISKTKSDVNKSGARTQSAVKSSPRFEGGSVQRSKVENVTFGEAFGKKPKVGSKTGTGDKPASRAKASPKPKSKTKPKKVASKATTNKASKATTKRKVKK